MYADIYQMKAYKYNYDKNNYISNTGKNNNYTAKPSNKTYLNKRPNSTKFINQPQQKKQYINYDTLKNTSYKPNMANSKRINPTM